MTINVLGTEYEVILNATAEEFEALESCDGYCDWSSKTIVVRAEKQDDDADKFEVFADKILRHELIHAFLNESGLQFDSENERMVDWMAIQIPKMAKMFDELGVM